MISPHINYLLTFDQQDSKMNFKTVAVTGAAGHIGGQIAFDLLNRGYVVHATEWRGSSERLRHLNTHEKAGKNLKMFEAELTEEGSYDAAFEGCDAVMHVASPYTFRARDVQKEIVMPAVTGTLNVLKSCRAKGVGKVVMTSSFVAIHSSKSVTTPGYIHTEVDWNDTATKEYMPYVYSKKVAEQSAWEFVKNNDCGFDLVVINPVGVFGPALCKSMMSESMRMTVDILEGKYMGIVDFNVPFVDVRDVSLAHIKAMESPYAQGRYICAAQSGTGPTHLNDVVTVAIRNGFDVPKRDLTAPWISRLLKVISYLLPAQEGHVVRDLVGVKQTLSNEKIVRDLGMKFRGLDETFGDMFASLLQHGHLKKVQT